MSSLLECLGRLFSPRAVANGARVLARTGLALYVALHALDTQASPVRARAIKATEVPRALEGRFIAGARWTDTSGENVIALSVIGERPDPAGESDGRRADLRAVRFLKAEGVWRPVWTVRDGVEDCALDITAEFVTPSLAVTDVDGDGLAEASFLYRLGCMGGLDPTEQKLILYEGSKKYALRGETRFLYREDGERRSVGGDQTPDKAFDAAPELLRFALRQWKTYGSQTLQP